MDFVSFNVKASVANVTRSVKSGDPGSLLNSFSFGGLRCEAIGTPLRGIKLLLDNFLAGLSSMNF